MSAGRAVITVADQPDIALIVKDPIESYDSQTLEILVSSTVLRSSPRGFRNLLRTGFKEAEEFEAHKAKGNSKLYELSLEHDQADGIIRLCAALHQKYDLIPCANSTGREEHFAVVLGFAEVIEKYQCFSAEVKHAAKLSLQDFVRSDGECPAELWLRAAYEMKDTESFSQLTDIIVKYRDPEMVGLQSAFLPQDDLHSIEGKSTHLTEPLHR